MASENRELKPVIAAIARCSPGDTAQAATVALLNIIPFAGGAIASIIGEVATHRRVARICDVLGDLNRRLEEHGGDPKQYLNEDQIIEVVHSTLQSATTTSDRDKLAYLKNGLAFAFLRAGSYEEKQVFLEVLRSCTSVELAVVRWAYGPDPFEYRIGTPPLPSQNVTVPTGRWIERGLDDVPVGAPLVSRLASGLGVEYGVAVGAARITDGKGLTAIQPNLEGTNPCRVLQWVTDGASPSEWRNLHDAPGFRYPIPESTPHRASQTDFGQRFVSFCQSV